MTAAAFPSLENLIKMPSSEQLSTFSRLRQEITRLKTMLNASLIKRQRKRLDKLEMLKLQYQTKFPDDFIELELEDNDGFKEKKPKKKAPWSDNAKSEQQYLLKVHAREKLIKRKRAEISLRQKQIKSLSRELVKLRQTENRRRRTAFATDTTVWSKRHSAEIGVYDSKYRMPHEVRCKECRELVLKKNLPRHQALHQEYKVKHKCEQCSATFSRLDNLKRHEKRHSLGRTFQCAKCGSGFERKNQLAAHTPKCVQALE